MIVGCMYFQIQNELSVQSLGFLMHETIPLEITWNAMEREEKRFISKFFFQYIYFDVGNDSILRCGDVCFVMYILCFFMFNNNNFLDDLNLFLWIINGEMITR